jgi:hypothetical protein
MSRMVWWTWLGLGSGLLVPQRLPAEEVRFSYSREVVLPTAEREELIAIPLDADVYAHTQPGFSDLRVFGPEGRVVPYLLRRRPTIRERTVRRLWRAEDLSARFLEDGGLELTFTRDEESPTPEGLSIVTPLTDFERRVRVEASADGSNWQTIADETVIFDYTRVVDVRNADVRLQETSRRTYRVTIDQITAAQESELLELTRRLGSGGELDRQERTDIRRRPFRIERLDLWTDNATEQVTEDELQPYEVSGFEVEQDAARKQTRVRIDTRQEPLTSLTIVTATRNFSRNVEVQVALPRGTETDWQPLAEGRLLRLGIGRLEREELTLTFPETRAAQYQLVIHNGDSPVVAIDGVKGAGHVYEVICLAGTSETCRLSYGAEEAESPEFDVVALRLALEEGIAPLPATLGAPQSASPPGPFEFRWSRLLNDPRFLIPVVLVFTLFLGVALYHAARTVDSLPEEPSSGE